MNQYRAGRLLGTRRENIEQVKVALVMFVVTALYEWLTLAFVPDYALNMYEFVGTWTGLVCVWLSRTENILCWPWGIVSSLTLGFFFSEIGLPGQQWLNWVYFTLIQVWAWPYWAFGGAEKQKLSVTRLSWGGRLATLLGITLFTIAIYSLIDLLVPGSLHPILDAVVVASSIVAQFLLGRKKMESWILWLGPVNLLSIALFFSAGAYTLTALYAAFFVHACFALKEWSKLETKHE